MEIRTFDGSNNNLAHPAWGAAGTQLLRKTPVGYEDGVSSLAVRGDPVSTNPRNISNLVCLQAAPQPNDRGLSNFMWAWGQFLDHEIDLTEPTGDAVDITTPTDDPVLANGTISFNRSIFDEASGTDAGNPRQQINQISAYIDATNVYGPNTLRASALRLFDGTGRLKVSTGLNGDIFLPYNVPGLQNASLPGIEPASLFVAGDIRCNEHAVLTCMHTLFVREHNRLCLEIEAYNPRLVGNDEAIYQLARKVVGGFMQAITYNEFLPALLGDSLAPYSGYKNDVNASIANIFSTAAYRLGHSMLSSVLFSDKVGRTLRLRDTFFNPRAVTYYDLDPFFRALATERMQEINLRIVEDVRSFLFGPPENGNLLDLAALNIQRGRDHGLPGYNACRVAYGLAAKADYPPEQASELEQIYGVGNVGNMDPWIGALAEDHPFGSSVGELINAVLKDQFERLQDGDRFWYESDPDLTDEWKQVISNTRLSDIIRRNSDLIDIQDDVFRVV